MIVGIAALPDRVYANQLLATDHTPAQVTDMTAASQSTGASSASVHVAAADTTSNVCLAIDDSGSMWMQTDQGPASDPGPNPLRAQAARAAISLLGADVNNPRDGVGVVLFGTADKPGDDIIALPVTELSSNAAREGLNSRIDASMWSKGFTRIDRALDSCLVLLTAAPTGGTPARIILLTDGVPVSADPRFDAAGQLQALNWTLNELANRKWSVDVILLGETGPSIANDTNSFASRIANNTGGSVFVAHERTDLLRIYTRIIASMTGRSLVQGDPVDLSNTSSVPVRVEERTALMTVTVVKSDASTSVGLTMPNGRAVEQGEIVRTSTGLVETLTLREPIAGLWSINLAGQGQAYVSLVLKPIEASVHAVPTAEVAAASPATNGGSARVSLSSVTRTAGLIGLFLVSVVIVWLAWARIKADRFIGVVAVADSPAKVVRLANLERQFRVLGIVQRPIPLAAVATSLGLQASDNRVLSVRGGILVIATPSGNGGAVPVVYGKALQINTAPPTNLVFARSIEELPSVRFEPTSGREATTSSEEEPIGDIFEPARTADESEPREQESVVTPSRSPVHVGMAGDDDAW